MTAHAAVISMPVPHLSAMTSTHCSTWIAMPPGTAIISMTMTVTSGSLTLVNMDKNTVVIEHQYRSTAQLDTQLTTGLDNDGDNGIAGIVGSNVIENSLRQISNIQCITGQTMVKTQPHTAVVIALVAVHTVMVEVASTLVEVETKPVFQKYLVAELRYMEGRFNVERGMVLFHIGENRGRQICDALYIHVWSSCDLHNQ